MRRIWKYLKDKEGRIKLVIGTVSRIERNITFALQKFGGVRR